MTPAQLELKRLRELLSGVRKARHLLRAMRTPLARLVRFERAAAEAWNRPLAKLERIQPDHGFEATELLDARAELEHLDSLTTSAERNESKVIKRIESLSKSKRLTATPKPVEQRWKDRRTKKAKASAKRAAFEQAHAKWEANVRASAERWLGKQPHEKSVSWLEDIARDATQNSAMARSAIRHAGDVDIADDLLAAAQSEPRP